jgi:succinate dehydrogenase / fumarate reductase cytochrome b subunit
MKPVVDRSLVPSIFGRHQFLVRRLHSLTGLVPIGGFLCIHLATNATILDGPDQFQRRVDQIHSLGPSQLLFLEWAFIFLPIIFHGLVGLLIVTRGMRNVTSYPYAGNIRYILQRTTGVIAFLFIFWHVFHMHGWLRFDWWTAHIAEPLGGASFKPKDAPATAAAAIQTSPAIFAIYAIGILACVYHLSNGLWTMGITWGIWVSPKAQQKANIPFAVFGLLLAAVGLGALIGMQTQELPAPASGLRREDAEASENAVPPIELAPISPSTQPDPAEEDPLEAGTGQ